MDRPPISHGLVFKTKRVLGETWAELNTAHRNERGKDEKHEEDDDDEDEEEPTPLGEGREWIQVRRFFSTRLQGLLTD